MAFLGQVRSCGAARMPRMGDLKGSSRLGMGAAPVRPHLFHLSLIKQRVRRFIGPSEFWRAAGLPAPPMPATLFPPTQPNLSSYTRSVSINRFIWDHETRLSQSNS